MGRSSENASEKIGMRKMNLRNLLVVTGLSLLPLYAEDPAGKELSMLESGGQALIVRSAAVGSPRTAFRKWFMPPAAAEFERLTADTFDGQRSYELSDFFNTSLILVGAQQPDRGITAFYSPWQDAILLVRTEGRGTDRRGAEFVFLTGETFRGEKFADSLEPVTPKEAPLSVTLWRVYSATLAKFNSLFPEKGVPDLSGLTKDLDRAAEFRHIRLRSAARTLLAKKLMTEPYREGLANCLIALRALRRGEPEVLKKVFGARDEAGLAGMIEKIPQSVRKNIEPVYSLVSKDSALFGYLNPGAPRFIFIVGVDKTGRFALEWFDINESGALLKAWEDAK